MKNYLREARNELSGDYISAACASMIYYIALFLLFHMAVTLPIDSGIRIFLVTVLALVVLIPLTSGYIKFFKFREFGDFPSPKKLFYFSKTFIPLAICILIIALVLVLSLALLMLLGVQVAVFCAPTLRFYVLVFFAFLWLLFAIYMDCRMWPLFFLAQSKEEEKFTFYLKECLKMTKKKEWDYLRVVLRHWRLFVVCVLPLLLGLLVFFPILTVAKQHYFDDLVAETTENK